jgi:HEAT repeat protein
MKNLKLFLCISAALFLSAACFESEQFDDYPPDLEKKEAVFNVVSKEITNLQSAGEAKAVQLLSHADYRVRRAAALRLKKLNRISPSSVEALVKRMKKEPIARVRSAIVRALDETGGTMGAAAVLNAACDSDSNVRLYANKAIIHLGAAAYGVLIDGLNSKSFAAHKKCNPPRKNYTLKQEIENILATMGTKALPVLLEARNSNDKEVKIAAMELLGNLKEEAASALPGLLNDVTYGTEDVCVKAIETIAKIGDKNPMVMPTLYNAQNNPSQKIAAAAGQAINRINFRQKSHSAKRVKRKSGRRG